MVNFRVSKDIVPVSEFKAQAAEWLRRIAGSGHPLVITQNGKPAGVLLSPAAFDELSETQNFVSAVHQGMEDEKKRRSYSSEEVFEVIEDKIAALEAE